MLDILLLNYNDSETTRNTALAVSKYKNVDHVLIVDNNSTDNSFEKLQNIKADKIKTIKAPRNGGYGYGNNFGITYLLKKNRPDYILIMNPDTEIKDKTIGVLRLFLEKNPEYVIVAPYMVDPKGKKQYNSAFYIPTKIEFILSISIFCSKFTKSHNFKESDSLKNNYSQVDAVSGSLFLVNAEKMKKYGMYDEGLFLYFEELTLGIKLKKAGLKTAIITNEKFIHNHSVSISKTYRSLLSR